VSTNAASAGEVGSAGTERAGAAAQPRTAIAIGRAVRPERALCRTGATR